MPINMHINGTGKPVLFKTWMCDPVIVTANHFVVLKSHNIDARCQPEIETITGANGRQYQYTHSNRAYFVTTCEEQEVVLQLMYGNNLALLRAEYVLPNMMMSYE